MDGGYDLHEYARKEESLHSTLTIYQYTHGKPSFAIRREFKYGETSGDLELRWAVNLLEEPWWQSDEGNADYACTSE